MTNFKTVFFALGTLLIILGFFMITPVIVQLIYDEFNGTFIYSSIVTIFIGTLFLLSNLDQNKKILIKLDPVLRNIPNKNQDKINAWIKDQYIHPVESTHTFDEVLKWFEMNNIEFVNSVPESSPFNNTQKNLFEMNSKATFIERILQQLAMIFTSFGSEGGLFLFIGKKKN